MFDEEVFPFSELHPNAGARLCSKINLLHPTLLNLGGAHAIDQLANILANPAVIPIDLTVDENLGTFKRKQWSKYVA